MCPVHELRAEYAVKSPRMLSASSENQQLQQMDPKSPALLTQQSEFLTIMSARAYLGFVEYRRMSDRTDASDLGDGR